MPTHRAVRDVITQKRRYALFQGDCLNLMYGVPEHSVDLILCDLPYGITNCSWDETLPFQVLWWHYKRILKQDGAIVLTATQPFATDLGSSCRSWLKCEWIWDKVNRSTGFANAKKRPMRIHENVMVFYRRQPTYNPQMTKGKPYRTRNRQTTWDGLHSPLGPCTTENRGERYPTSILRVPAAGGEATRDGGLHPTQKPVALMEYFVKTYSNAGELVLDNCMGSGTTGVACMRTGRRFIGMELTAEHFATSRKRITTEARRWRTIDQR